MKKHFLVITNEGNVRFEALTVKKNEELSAEEIEDAIKVNASQRSAEDFKEGVLAFKQRRRAEWPSLHAKV